MEGRGGARVEQGRVRVERARVRGGAGEGEGWIVLSWLVYIASSSINQFMSTV